MIDHKMTVANRKMGHIEKFQWYRWEVLADDSILMTGCVSSGLVLKGKRKGKPRYDGEPRSIVVTLEEEHAEERRFERDTGKCAECGGDGNVFAGWHHIHGTSHRTCQRCKGVGSAQAVDAVREEMDSPVVSTRA